MRELIHRAWDKTKKKMIYPACKNCSGPIMSYWIDNENPGFVVMAYTGKNDINEVKIFEGDIVDCRFRGKGTVIFEESCFIVKIEPNWQYVGRMIEPVVIGNIYENPV